LCLSRVFCQKRVGKKRQHTACSLVSARTGRDSEEKKRWGPQANRTWRRWIDGVIKYSGVRQRKSDANPHSHPIYTLTVHSLLLPRAEPPPPSPTPKGQAPNRAEIPDPGVVVVVIAGVLSSPPVCCVVVVVGRSSLFAAGAVIINQFDDLTPTRVTWATPTIKPLRRCWVWPFLPPNERRGRWVLATIFPNHVSFLVLSFLTPSLLTHVLQFIHGAAKDDFARISQLQHHDITHHNNVNTTQRSEGGGLVI